MKLNKDICRELSNARNSILQADNKLVEITNKILLNIEYEKAGEAMPFDYRALHAEAEELRNTKETAPEALTDNAALFAPELFPALKNDGSLVKTGTRINYGGKLYRAASDVWDYEMYNPAQAPSLWEIVIYHDGVREIPEVITTTSAFSKGELGSWKGAVYESLIDNNVWNPDVYPSGWKLI